MNVDFLALLTSGFIPLCVLAASALIWVIRMRPANSLAANEAERIKLEALLAAEAIIDAQRLRAAEEIAHHLGRIKDLEAQRSKHETEIETCHRERDLARAGEMKWKLIVEAGGQMKEEAAKSAAGERLLEDKTRKNKEGNENGTD